MSRIHLGISTCPNDTFAFHALMTGAIDLEGLTFDVELMDVQELNERMVKDGFDVCKASYYCALAKTEQYVVLPSGSALGFGVGPLLLGAREGESPDDSEAGQRPLVLCPGEWTTAHLLYRIFHPGQGEVEQALFSDIMPRLQNGTADFGVCIHEGRFTWRESGLARVEDLGERWEVQTKSPLPLGGIFARRDLGADTIARVQRCIRASIDFALEHREATFATMQRHAVELSPEVIWSHVDLYVNAHTQDLGTVGRDALRVLEREARGAGLLEGSAHALEVFELAR